MTRWPNSEERGPGLLVVGPLGHLLCVPLSSHIHEGLVFSNRDRRTLLDKFAQLFLGLTLDLESGVLLVADAYYASRIELAFKQALYTLGSYGYHFWMMAMTPRSRRSGNQYLHSMSMQMIEPLAMAQRVPGPDR